MGCCNRSYSEQVFGRPPWILLVCLTSVFFFAQHDWSYPKRGIDNYNLSAVEIVAAQVEGSPEHRVALVSLAIISLFSLARGRLNGRFRIKCPFGCLLLTFCIWASLSLIWTDDFLMTVRGLGVFWILCIAAVAVVRCLSIREIILWTFLTTGLYLLIGICAEINFQAFHPFSYGYRFAGTQHPNGAGIECGLLCLSAVAAADTSARWRVYLWTVGAIGLLFLLLTGSRTSLAATVCALASYLIATRSRQWIAAFAGSTVPIACFLVLFLGARAIPGFQNAILLGRDDPESFDTLTGRTMIWDNVGDYIRQRPLLGYGYSGFWTSQHISEMEDKSTGAVAGSHSAYLEYLLTLGPVGVTAYVLLLIFGIRRAVVFYKVSGLSEFAFCGMVLVFCAIDGALESVIVARTLLAFIWMTVVTRLAFVSAVTPNKTFVATKGIPACLSSIGRYGPIRVKGVATGSWDGTPECAPKSASYE